MTGTPKTVRVVYDPEKTPPSCCSSRSGENHDPTTGEPAGQRRRHGLPLGHLLDHREPAARRRGHPRGLPEGAHDNGFGQISTEIRSPTTPARSNLAEDYHQGYLHKNRRLLQPRPERHDVPRRHRAPGPAARAADIAPPADDATTPPGPQGRRRRGARTSAPVGGSRHGRQELPHHRTTTISATPERIHALIDDFREWQAWSPWRASTRRWSAPTRARRPGSVPSTPGAATARRYQGRMEILESEPHHVAVDLLFAAPMKATTASTSP